MTMTLNRGVWTADEHDRFLAAIQIYPHGPWRYVAKHVGSRDVRQVQTHAQKYYEKVGRHMRGLRKERRSWVRSEHRIDDLPPGLQRSTIPPPEERAPRRAQVAPLRASAPVPPRSIKVESPHSEYESKDEGSMSDWSDRAESPRPTPQSDAEMASSLPSLEESLDILLTYLSDY